MPIDCIDVPMARYILYSYYFVLNKLIESEYRLISDIWRTFVDDKNVYHSDIVGASPVSAVTEHLASIDCTQTTARRGKKHLSFGIWCD